MTEPILHAIARLCLRHSKAIATVSILAGLLALAGASRVRFDTDLFLRGTLDDHVVMLQPPPGADRKAYEPLLGAIEEGYRKSSRIEAVRADPTTLRIDAKPKRPARDIRFARQLLAEGSIIEARALKDFALTVPKELPMPSVVHGGGYETAVADAVLVRRDMVVTFLVSLVGVLFLFLYAFRRPVAIVYATLPLAVALALTYGVAGLRYGRLSPASAGLAALVIGIGTGFITILYGRYVEERNRGDAMAHALIVAIRRTLPALIVAAIAAAATREMTQLGILTATGVLCFLLCTAFLLPALIAISEREPAQRAGPLTLHAFGFGTLIGAAMRRPKATIGSWIVFLAVCGAIAPRIAAGGKARAALMTLGAGLGFAVYILQRYVEDPSRFRLAVHETGKAVTLAALMTAAGYGAFALSHYPGLRSIGYASCFGIFFSGLAATTLLPAILVLLRRRQE